MGPFELLRDGNLDSSNSETCDECGGQVRVGDWPFCKGDPSKHVSDGAGHLEPWKPYYDDHVAPPPKLFGEHDGFSNPKLPNYVWGKGYEIRHRDDRKRLMKLNRMEERG